MLRLDINLVFTIINLIIFYLLYKKFLFKPVREVMAKREEEIRAGYAAADAAKAEAQQLKETYEKDLEGMEDQRRQKMADAEAEAGEAYDRILQDAEREKQKILAQAKEMAETEKARTVEEGRRELLDYAREAGCGGQTDDAALYDAFLQDTKSGN